MARRTNLSNKQLAAMFAKLRAEGKLVIRPDILRLGKTATIIKLKLHNPEVLSKEFRRAGSRVKVPTTLAMARLTTPIGHKYAGIEPQYNPISKEWLKRQRLTTALHVLSLREVKRRGYAGLSHSRWKREAGPSGANYEWSVLGPKTHYDEMWDQLKSQTPKLGVQRMTSVRPHAKRRGRALRRARRKRA